MRKTVGSWALLAGAGMLIAALATAQEKQDKPAAAPGAQAKPAASQPAASQPAAAKAPKKLSITAKSISGKDIQIPGPQFAGKIVLVNFWATWCPYCKKELSFWKDANEKYHDLGLEVVGVSSDANRSIPADKVAEFVKEQNMPWEQIYDNQISSKNGATSLPWSFLVDGDTGNVIAERNDIRRDNLAKVIVSALAEKNLQNMPAKKNKP